MHQNEVERITCDILFFVLASMASFVPLIVLSPSTQRQHVCSGGRHFSTKSSS